MEFSKKLFLVNILSSSGLLASSDLLIQIVYERRTSLDKRRLFAALITGAIMGIEGHVWYKYLDNLIVERTWRGVFKKVLLDQIIGAPCYTLTYIVGTSVIEGRTTSREITSDIQANFLPLYLVDCFLYSPIQLINFKYVSSFYRIPFLSATSFIFDAFITGYKHEHEGIQLHDKYK